MVQGVINRGPSLQFVLVERSIAGDSSVPDDTPPGRPPLAVAGARVLIEHLGPGPCAGTVDTLAEQVSPAGGPSGLYRAVLCGTEPGARLALRVEAPDGIVRGETEIPGAAERVVEVGAVSARFSGDTLPFQRERDTLRIAVTPRYGRALQVEVRRADFHDALTLMLYTDSLGLTLPGTLTNPFDDGRVVFRAGRYQMLTVALADSNYYDYVRSASDPVTGRGFLNHLAGGVGVFGSVDAESYVLRVTGDVDQDVEGLYRITGRAGTEELDFTMEPFIHDLDQGRFSAFVMGIVSQGPVNQSGDGMVNRENGSLQFSFEVFRTGPPRFHRHSISGFRTSDGTPFPVTYAVTDEEGSFVLTATLTARQLSGPPGAAGTP